jgi:NagD protein
MPFDKYSTPMTERQLMAACSKIKHVALDMDGTIYMGSTLFPYTHAFLEMLTALGISYSFLTNNPTKNRGDYLRKLQNLGIEASDQQMYTSSIATIDYIRQHYPGVKRIYALGTPSMQAEFRKAGFELTLDDPSDRPDMLVVAFDTTLTYERFCRAAWWASKKEIPYIATNPDWVCPTDERTILVDCGSITACLEGATKRRPDVVIGKPNPGILQCILDKLGLQPHQAALVGDRLYTDVQTALNAGSCGVLVLSGEGTLADVEAAKDKPTLVCRDIEEFGNLLEEARR